MSELEKEVNGLDPDDIGLKGIFGERFEDDTAQIPPVEQTSKKAIQPTNTRKAAQNPTGKAMEGQWEPVKPEPGFMDNLKDCAKAAVLFGGLSSLIFYWQQAGLMAESIAVPSMCVCTALLGWSIGKYAAKRGNR